MFLDELSKSALEAEIVVASELASIVDALANDTINHMENSVEFSERTVWYEIGRLYHREWERVWARRSSLKAAANKI